MPSRFLLTYAVTNILCNEIREGFDKDKDLYYTDNSIQNRINVPKVLDSWNYKIREYPSIIVNAVPGQNRRMGIGDSAAIPYFGLSGSEDSAVGSAVFRKFFVSNVLPIGTIVHVEYTGDTVPEPAVWDVPVQETLNSDPPERFIEITGTNIGPGSRFPASGFAFTGQTPTADQYGGFFDFRTELFVVTLSPIEREIILDKLWAMLWFSRKREIMVKGVIILDVSYGGTSQQDFGADKIYIGKVTVTCATEFRQLVYYLDTVEGITINAEASASVTQ
jgi:hypothetical protein